MQIKHCIGPLKEHRRMPAARMRTIRRAVDALGGAHALARALGTTTEDVVNWASGVTVAPDGAFFAALDIVATQPLCDFRRGNASFRGSL
jgi:DNA-binding transcriptional regulator YiaG